MDSTLFEKCQREHGEKQRKLDQEREACAAKWKSIVDAAAAAGIDVVSLTT